MLQFFRIAPHWTVLGKADDIPLRVANVIERNVSGAPGLNERCAGRSCVARDAFGVCRTENYGGGRVRSCLDGVVSRRSLVQVAYFDGRTAARMKADDSLRTRLLLKV